MPRFTPFVFHEILNSNGRARTPEALVVTNRSPEILLILRLLSGSLKITHQYSDTDILCKTNYFTGDFRGYGQRWSQKFPKLISEDMSSSDLAHYIRANQYNNMVFYKNILTEISQFIYLTKKKSHTSAFIFVYRLLEKIAYAFPLIYASRTNDFVRSFKQLKELMIGDTEKKELGFFKKFVEMLYKDDPISETSIDINIDANNPEVKRMMFMEMKRVLDDRIIHEATIDYENISINYCDMGSFIITIRNRFFHNMNGGANNIKSDQIVDSDLFFKSINDLSIQWISNVLLGIVAHSIAEFQTVLNTTI
ncbi:MAG: hypothetical protein HRT88_00080 [Lentisphaeraceae bacterium]|nr:hypothetical protein [Lentisphaeraceae bacterium]